MRIEELFTILNNHGYDNQTFKLVEEMGELTQAIMKMHFDGYDLPENVSENFIEELVDVYLVLMQLKYGLEMKDQRKFEEILDSKINRTLRLIKGEKKWI